MNEFIYIPKAAEHPITWIENHLPHYIGELKGKPFLLEEWQKDILRETFGWRLKTDTRYLKHTNVWLEIPRGNGKSTLAVGVGLYIAFGLGIESSKVYCFASSLKQSKEAVFDPAKFMSEYMNERFDAGLRLYHSTVKDPATDSEFILMSADWKGAHSLVGTAFIIDEIHLHSDSRLFDAVESGDSKRTDFSPLIIVCTTSGTRNTFGHEKHQYAKRVQEGLIKDESWLVRIYTAGEAPDDDPEYYFKEETHRKANPGFAYINQYKFAQKVQKAKNSSTSLNTFLRYNLNIWVGSSTAWIPAHKWAKGKGGKKFSELRGEGCFVGLYVTAAKDISSCCLFFPSYGQLIWRFWCPEVRSFERKESLVGFAEWVSDGWITEVDGEVLSDEPVVEWVSSVSQRVKINRIAYHSQEATSKIDKLQNAGFKMDPMNIGTHSHMSAPSKKLEEMLVNGFLKHGGNPVVSYMVDCTQMNERNELIRPDSKESSDNISGVFAAIMAIGTWMDNDSTASVYDNRGILYI